MAGRSIGEYRVLSELGSGGMARVYLAEKDGERVAVKVLHRHLLEEGVFLERFRREVQAGLRVRHPNLVRTLDYGVAEVPGEGDTYLVMEYVEGETLSERLDRRGRLGEDLCLRVAIDAASALSAIHAAGIIHRDLKPENLILPAGGGLKITDLGIAFLADEAIRLSLTGQFVGSVFYAAPEQVQGGGKDLDARVDLYQLGVLLYELLCGEHPYRAGDIKIVLRRLLTEEPVPLGERRPEVSAFLAEVVATLMQKRRDRRFQTADALLRVLRAGEDSEWWRQRKDRAGRAAPRVHVPRETRMYGRDRELARMRELFAEAADGTGQTVLVEGEAGIGKSRFVLELGGVLRSEATGATVLLGRTRPGAPFAAYSEAFRDLADHDPAAVLRSLLPDSPGLAPTFASFLSGGRSGKEGTPDRGSIQSAVAGVTRSLARRVPVVLVIEDLHLATPEGLALFAGLSVDLADSRTLLVGTARPGLPEDWRGQLGRREHFCSFALGRLSEEDLGRLLADSLGSPRLAESLLARIALKSDGKPLYVFELLRELREGQFIGQREDGTWVTTREVRALPVPPSLMEMVVGRLDGLSEVEREILNVAALVGYEFDPGTVAKVLEMGRIPLLKRLGFLEKGLGLVHSKGRRYAFDDHPLREAVVEALPPGRRRRLHGTLASLIEEEAGEAGNLAGHAAVDFCRHCFEAGETGRARAALPAALDRLEALNRHEEAAETIGRVLDDEGLLGGEGRTEMLLLRARHLSFAGRSEEERIALEEAVGLSEAARVPLAAHYRRTSDYGKALAVLRPGGGPEAAVEEGRVLLAVGRFREARAAFDRALGLPGGETAGGWAGFVDLEEGRHEEAERRLGILAEAEGDDRAGVRARLGLADALDAQGRLAEAQPVLEAAAEAVFRTGDRRGEALRDLGLGRHLTRLGCLRAGRQRLEEARAVFRQIGSRDGEATAIHELGVVAGETGRSAEAESLFRESLEIRRSLLALPGVADTLARLGILLGRGEDRREGTEMLVEALERARGLDRPGPAVLAAIRLAVLGRGDPDFAARSLVELADRMTLFERLEAHVALHRILPASGHLSRARALLDMLLENAPAGSREAMASRLSICREVATLERS